MSIPHFTSNSAEVKKGSTFIALKGLTFDGHHFIEDAIKRGATTVYYSEALKFFIGNYPKVGFIFDKNLKSNLPIILKEVYTMPSKIIAITGTNGKTSTAFLTMQSLGMLGIKAGFVGTIGVFAYSNKIEKIAETELTTPDAVSLYYFFALLKSKGIDCVIFEATSVGLVQKRIAGLKIDVGVFLNFSQDHLDIHKTMEEYFRAKSLLFSEFLSQDGVAIFDDIKFPILKDICRARNIKTLQVSEATETKLMPESASFKIEGREVKINLSGSFQVENITFAIAICSYFGFKSEEVINILSKLKAPDGRLECVYKKPYIFIDYAHTPESLLKAIETLKQAVKGKIIVVFGCGGDRDISKRSIMGGIASRTADFCIITDDNPRREDASKIRKDIISGFENQNFKEIPNRNFAIKEAISMALPEDAVLIAGKGHENYQIIGTQKQTFSDAKCVSLAIKDLKL
jgi:UDP-N-acetylmuramoyl-L-alanyl-D-glutamate--2,6-diaminopimelate ligase